MYISALIGWSYVLFGIGFGCILTLVNIAIVRNRDLSENLCYKLLLAGNVVDAAMVFNYGIVDGALEIAGPNMTSAAFNKFVGSVIAGFGASQELLSCSLSLSRFFFVMNFLQSFSSGCRCYIWIIVPLLCAIPGLLLFTIREDYNVTYNHNYHVRSFSPPSPQWTVIFVEAENLLTVAISIVCHAGYFIKLYKRSRIMSKAAKKDLNLKQGMQVPIAQAVLYLIGELYFFFLQPLIPYDCLPGVAGQMVMICFYGTNGFLCIFLNRTIRREVAAVLKLEGKRFRIFPGSNGQKRIFVVSATGFTTTPSQQQNIEMTQHNLGHANTHVPTAMSFR